MAGPFCSLVDFVAQIQKSLIAESMSLVNYA